MKVLILTDGKAGHQNQTIALAKSMGLEYDLVPVHFKNKLAKLIAPVFDWLHISSGCLFTCGRIPSPASEYSFVAGTGSGTFYPVKVIAARMTLESRIIFYPRLYRTGSFSRIYVPYHDNPPSKPNIERIHGAFVYVSQQMKDQAVEEFKKRNSNCADHAFALVVGGPSKYATMDYGWMRQNLDQFFRDMSAWKEQHPGSSCAAWVTTSRRTPSEIEELVKQYPWDFCQISSQDTYNPIPAFAVLADKVYVTAESISMVSEIRCAATGQVCLLDNLKPGGHKLRRFIDSLS